MGIFKFFRNRYNILYIVVFVIITILAFRLATLTIVEGEKYKEMSEIKKIKDIPIKAPRGSIYDRNGVVLAENLTSFTVQLYKNKLSSENFTDTISMLTQILEENGESLIDDFPIILDSFEYKEGYENKEKSETEYVIDLINNNGLLFQWLSLDQEIDGTKLNIKEKTYRLINDSIKNFPIKLENGQFVYKTNADETKQWLKSNCYDESYTSDQLMQYLMTRDNRYMLNLLSNSRVRQVTYNFLKDKGLTGNLELVKYSFLYDAKYETLKNSLIEKYAGITSKTTAKEDFIYLTKLEAFDYLFNSVYGEDKEQFAPAESLVKKLKETYPDLPVDVTVKDTTVTYEYTKGKDKEKDKLIKELNLESNVSAYHLVKTLAFKDNKVVNSLITSKKISGYAQTELLNRGVNPNISISSWEYTPIRDKNNWISTNVSKTDKDKSAEEIFKKLKIELKLKVDKSDYDVRNILVIQDRYNKQGYLSYYPIDICYNVSEKSVAMISERNYDLEGVNIEIEPIRYYPENNLAAHLLGYLGKISQENEIEEYIDKQGYSLDDIIGKTGLEEKFESYLSGTKGKKTVAVNATGNTVESVNVQQPVPGDNLHLTIDANLQKKAQEALEKGLKTVQVGGTYESEWGTYKFNDPYKNATSGAIVALDVKTGEVLALANYPTYDLNMFSTGISSEDWNSLLNESKDPLAPKPLYNIALQTAIQPGSTFKMVTALAALQKGVSPYEKVYCAGVMEVGGRNFGCWIYNMHPGRMHGYQNLYEAIKNSCNFYFYTTMLGENPATGQGHSIQLTFDEVTKMATELGLNDKTGIEIDLPSEHSGGVPDLESKKSTMKLYLRLFLEEKLSHYVKDGYKMDQTELSDAINEIVSWVNAENMLSRNEVYERLQKLNIDPDKTYGDSTPLVDVIKYTYINQSVWNSGDSLNLAIGQGSNAYTPIQMANYVATIANGGYLHNVSVVKKVEKYDKSEVTYEGERVSNRIDLKNYDYLDIVKEGMRLVSLDSSVWREFPVSVGVKTGTAQKDGTNPETGEPYDNFAWYVAFAPFDDPQIAISCILFQGGSGVYPAPIVRDVIAEYLVQKGELQRPASNDQEANN